MLAHVRRTGGGDVGESLLLGEGAGRLFFSGGLGGGSPLFYQCLLNSFTLKEHID